MRTQPRMVVQESQPSLHIVGEQSKKVVTLVAFKGMNERLAARTYPTISHTHSPG